VASAPALLVMVNVGDGVTNDPPPEVGAGGDTRVERSRLTPSTGSTIFACSMKNSMSE